MTAKSPTQFTVRGVISFPKLDEAKVSKQFPSNPPKFGTQLIFDGGQLPAIQAAEIAALQAAVQNAKSGVQQMPPQGAYAGIAKSGDMVDHLGNQKFKGDVYRGKFVLNASSSADQPPIIRIGDETTKLDQQVPAHKMRIRQELYAGCECILVANAFAFVGNQGIGVTCFVQGVWKVGEGARLDNRVDADEVFDEMRGQVQTNVQPTNMVDALF